MERTAVVSIVDGCHIEFSASVWESENGLITLRHSNGATVAVLNQAHVKYIAFRDEKPKPPESHALGHEDVKKTELSAGDRAVVINTGDPWASLTVDVLGRLAGSRQLVVKRRGETECRLRFPEELRPVPEERRNESR